MATIEGSSTGQTHVGNDAENDSIWGAGGSDILYGGAVTGGGNDLLDGGTGNDTIYGGDGADTLIGAAGDDRLYGGAGIDTADFSRNVTALLPTPGFAVNNVAVNVNLAAGTAGGLGSDSLFGIENVITGGGADFVLGNSDANVITLGAGADTADGAAGSDTIYGEAGADSLLGAAGNDRLFGGADGDRLYGGIDNDLLDGGAGVDLLYGGSGRDTLIGGEGGDSLVGGQGVDFVDYTGSNAAVQVNLSDTLAETGGHAAGDTLVGIEGIIGSAFNDVLTGNADANIIDGGEGADTIFGGFGSDSITGGGGNDVIDTGPDTPPTVTPAPAENLRLDWDAQPGGSGSSFESGFSQSVTGSGGAARVTVSVTYTEDNTLSQFTEDDGPVTGGGDAVPIYAGPNDFPDGRSFDTTSAAVLYREGGPGVSEVTIDFAAAPGSGVTDQVSNVIFRISDIDTSDTADGFRDTVTVLAFDAFGNPVPVIITVGSSQLVQTGNTVSAVPQPGDPNGFNTSPSALNGSALYQIPGPVASIIIQYGDTSPIGSTQAILLSDVHFTTIPETAATADDDTVSGGFGEDFIQAGIGDDLLYGDEGRDTLLGEAGNDTLYGGTGNDLLNGGLDDDRIFGGADQDTLFGEGGNDFLDGGDGADQIYGGAGNDTIEAGAGADIVDGGTGNDTINFGSGSDTVYGGSGDDVIDDIPGSSLGGLNLIYGGDGGDTIWSGNDADTIYGDAGADVLSGEEGNDLIFGGTGNDQAFGGGGRDTLYGDEGNDTLDGGADADVLYAGSGDDIVFGGIGNDVLQGGAGTDAIFGGDDSDLINVFFTPTTNDVLGSESVFGGSGGIDNDILQIDTTGFTWARFDLVYDPTNSENGTITFFAADGITVIGTLTFNDIENLIIVCFTAGTKILTATGQVPVEDLKAGDLVVTRDGGIQPLRWVGRRSVSPAEMLARPELQPVRIAAGAFGDIGPNRNMMLSPQHRVLIEGARAEMYFGESEVLVPAKHLVGLADVARTVPPEGVTYVHILFDRHEIVLSDGMWTESFQPAERTLNAMDEEARAEVLALFPELVADVDSYPAARLSLKAHEARVLFSG